ncbi:class I SAM-dependent methyltransferase [Amycolatopsis thermophila]|uniref:SAM-dependent methyltransferase n=1 Tax=Amycolatopsis thermophila TaxID=206084 RepID=A0ABU0F292_9PSEU|nr:class I SAM-dependent methyltransferase [Amycolatopsis thermophila]MDQ0381641.1 SAM-dependent methyltransferase [Amycolatopsis thermophila]
MPTLPHEARATAESFGVDAARYDRSRPPYPAALIERIAAAGADVLDVGCGTGIAARQLRAAGCRVLGVDPDPRMAGFARDNGVATEVATFEAWDPAGRTFDAVVAAQSWHWVDPVAGLVKVARVLRPGGRFAVFAHAFAAPPEVVDAFAEVYRRVVPGSPFTLQAAPADLYQAGFAKIADGMREAATFDEPERWRFDAERTYTRDAWLDQLATTGGLTPLAPGQRAEVLDHVGAAIDRLGGRFTVPLTTLAVTATRLPW